jgi:hypothetical protein
LIVHVSFEAVVKGFAVPKLYLLMFIAGWDKIWDLCCHIVWVVRCGLGFVVAVVVDECADGVALGAFRF